MTEVTSCFDDRALRRVEAIQVMNPWMLDYARALNAGRDVDIRYAPPGIDDAVFRPLAARDPARDPGILCVGRLDDPRKNIGLLLEAFVRLPAAIQGSARLILAGSAAPPAGFWARAEALRIADRVEYVSAPSREALVRLYQRASVFALPSDEEGFGMVLLEAMACGVPVVATRCGGPDGIVSDEEDGFLVARDDAAAMADRLARLLGDPARNAAMGARARRTVEVRFATRVAGAAFVEVWDALLARAERRRCAG